MPTLAVTAIPIDDAILQEVAAELAREIYPLAEVLQRFNIPGDVFDRIKRTHHFQRMHAEALITWQSSTNTRERTRLKSEVMIEKMLEPSWRAFQDVTQPLAARVSMMQTVAKLAGLLDAKGDAPVATAVAPGDRVSITINLSQPPARYAPAGGMVIDAQVNGAAVVPPVVPGFATVYTPTFKIDKPQLDLPPSDPIEETAANSEIS